MESGPLVAVIMGSKSDADKVRPAWEMLERLGVKTVVESISAHRQPAKLQEFVGKAVEKGVEVFIAAAGKAVFAVSPACFLTARALELRERLAP